MKKLMDANVNLRYLLSDHPEFSEKARKTIAEGTHTLPEVMGEVVYVRKGVYKVERSEIRSASYIKVMSGTHPCHPKQ